MSSLGGPGIGWIWLTAIGVFGISCLGIGAACSENTIALKIVCTSFVIDAFYFSLSFLIITTLIIYILCAVCRFHGHRNDHHVDIWNCLGSYKKQGNYCIRHRPVRILKLTLHANLAKITFQFTGVDLLHYRENKMTMTMSLQAPLAQCGNFTFFSFLCVLVLIK